MLVYFLSLLSMKSVGLLDFFFVCVVYCVYEQVVSGRVLRWEELLFCCLFSPEMVMAERAVGGKMFGMGLAGSWLIDGWGRVGRKREREGGTE